MKEIENIVEGEVVKDVVGYEGLYAVTSLGRVWRYGTGSFKGRWLMVDRTGDSYVRVPLQKDGKRAWYYIHRLVAKALIPNPRAYSAASRPPIPIEVGHPLRFKSAT